MLYKDFVSLFKKQVNKLSFEEGLDLAIVVCKRLYFDYENFVSLEHWGDKDLLIDTIGLCELAKTNKIEIARLKEMVSKLDAITPDTEDFDDYKGSYALNSAASVYETLQFIMDKDLQHVYNIGTYLTDTVDFKIHEKQSLPDEEIDGHPLMTETRNFLLKQTK
jgi:uncharacterized protein YjaG (DUF416 family)